MTQDLFRDEPLSGLLEYPVRCSRDQGGYQIHANVTSDICQLLNGQGGGAMGISRDEICAQRIGLIAEMGSMEEEITVFGCCYPGRRQGEISGEQR